MPPGSPCNPPPTWIHRRSGPPIHPRPSSSPARTPSPIPSPAPSSFTGSSSEQKNQLVKTNLENGCDARPHPDPLPQGEGTAVARSGLANDCPTKAGSRHFKYAVSDSPSPSLAHRMGEGGRRPGEGFHLGRGEGERETNFVVLLQLKKNKIMKMKNLFVNMQNCRHTTKLRSALGFESLALVYVFVLAGSLGAQIAHGG